ncbi:hypothetical protein, unlikely [Trypanosoma brucei gambiense DAL972]|uniref:Uncharacterized protein n=1 Tax=Trypanosoma brucei gambiense (strain MHOM/CI/86/DAL972) TaxID=679716 RepID=C9ZTQ5_TRYB9|nr:hypothetical protein, unlikely [Trypanosoma brucei gambiense DAL972]CBH12790.1 hypothetical protein, unlikely [Trypanosoma brucei gambiense DAL972]|eukprot:XP_011775070.1 hypothetical protein, unlikely [Trypanosoma brucei gambiense DAL972]
MYTVGCNTNVSGGAVNKREKEETERMEKEEEKGILFVCLSCMSPCGTTPLLSHTKTQKNIINMSLFCITSCRSHFIFFCLVVRHPAHMCAGYSKISYSGFNLSFLPSFPLLCSYYYFYFFAISSLHRLPDTSSYRRENSVPSVGTY